MFFVFLRDMTVANIITGSRLAFFVVFVWAAHTERVEWAVVMFAVAWGLDAVDGWVARKMGQTSAFGYIFDKVVDRMVVFAGLLVLLVNEMVPDYALLILVKDIAVLPAASVQLGSLKAMPSMGWVGKMAAAVQGAAIIWVMAGMPASLWVVSLVAVLGGVAGAGYLYRVYYRK